MAKTERTAAQKKYEIWGNVCSIIILVGVILSFFSVLTVSLGEINSGLNVFGLMSGKEILPTTIGNKTTYWGKTQFSYTILIIVLLLIGGLFIFGIMGSIFKFGKTINLIGALLGGGCIVACGVLMFFLKNIYIPTQNEIFQTAVKTGALVVKQTGICYAAGGTFAAGGLGIIVAGIQLATK